MRVRLRSSLLDALRLRATEDLAYVGMRADCFTRLVVMPQNWRRMALEEELFRLVVDCTCVDPSRLGRLSRAEIGEDRNPWRYREGGTYWAVVSTSGFVLGRSKPISGGACALQPFISREDAEDFAGFPARDTNGAIRCVEWPSSHQKTR